MEIFESNLTAVRTLWQKPRARQSLQLVIYQAIAENTDMTAKDIEQVIQGIDQLLQEEEVQETRHDPAL
jgi:hypothetical protein